MTDNTNPGNFANRPKEEVQSIAQKGGQSSHTGGFASMDPDKQVGILSTKHKHKSLTLLCYVEGDCVAGRPSFQRLI